MEFVEFKAKTKDEALTNASLEVNRIRSSK